MYSGPSGKSRGLRHRAEETRTYRFLRWPARPQANPFEQIEGQGMHRTFWKATGTIGFQPALIPTIDQGCGEDAPRRVAGAEKQNFVNAAVCHVRPGLRASTIAETMWSSMFRPGAQVLISSQLSGFGVTRTSTNPRLASQPSTRSAGAAPAMQPHNKAGSDCSSAGSGAVLMMSDTASRPPGLRTRKASRNTCSLSGTRLITQFEITTSAALSAIGRCS